MQYFYEMSGTFFVEWKKYACDLWNDFMLQKSPNSHEIDDKSYNSIIYDDQVKIRENVWLVKIGQL